MTTKTSKIFFDKNDHQLLQIVNDVLEWGPESRTLRSLLVEHMHPHGIKEMAAPRGLRIAYAIVSLLGSFETGLAGDRIKALGSLRDEVFLSSRTFFQKNTARALLQIMKELVRCRNSKLRQLKLAHDFRIVSTGNPPRVREELAKYHLVEMPEDWNQIAFDDHVHDANTKGRKSPTHLVMDAWIKGIRYLTVVYYNYVRPEVIEELIEASAILDIKVQVGIEISTRFRDKYARFTWEPHGFNDNQAFLKFLGEEAVIKLMEEGREVSHYQQKYVFDTLQTFNQRHRKTINAELNISLKLLNHEEFKQFVGTGQPSILHLARFIHNALAVEIADSVTGTTDCEASVPDAKQKSSDGAERREVLTVDAIINQFLLPIHNPEVHDPTVPQDCPELPKLLKCGLSDILKRLLSLDSSSKFTLNLGNLSIQDTLELLYAGAGMVTHVEAYNLKNATHGMSAGVTVGSGNKSGETVDLKSPRDHYRLVGQLQKALNDDNVISLKRVIRAIIIDHEEQQLRMRVALERLNVGEPETVRMGIELEDMQARKLSLIDILYDFETLHRYYKKRTLGSRIGSGSTGQAEHQYGMGLVVLDTLPAKARKVFRESMAQDQDRLVIPVSALLTKNIHSRQYVPSDTSTKTSFVGRFSLTKDAHTRQWVDWSLDGYTLHDKESGNIATLGGLTRQRDDDVNEVDSGKNESVGEWWKYLNTNIKNILKVLLGFIPAFLTFSLTKDWWVLAYLGAFIWFSITGFRNILQSVLGGGGLRRSPLLPWNSLISWSRISDSLLYTGFSVPLLDFLIKTLLLDDVFGVTTSSNPILLYSVMGLANGIYISGHNTFRGLPKGAIVGNSFRSVFAIPMALILHSLIGGCLGMLGVPDVSDSLQKWATIISKIASDCVGAVIEGIADRQTNIRARLAAYKTKIAQVFKVFARLDLLFPEEDVLEMLQSPKIMMKTLGDEAQDLERFTIVNALDLMYFWMYQPRARKALLVIVDNMSEEEWLIFYRSQFVLKRHKEISQVFVDGLVGKHFSKALAFYLDQAPLYLRDLKTLGEKRKMRSDQRLRS
ncbi:MAG: hypothetical protein COA36_15590 [Desulfotalea sp.]|nr:MAG: hypothetical protein COA36_15590 [Desulfotalea sp.]